MSDGVVARGRIKVDARRALDKLRDHMLVDPHLWVCEIARAAVALGATRLDVAWDAEELCLDFDGRALPPEALARARDHVLTPEEGPAGDALRAIGIGVGAALSLDPAYVDVLMMDGDGAARVRFERGYIGAEGAAPLPARAPAPRDLASGATMRVLRKRRLGLESIGRALSREAPREIGLLEEAVDQRRIALHLRGSAARARSKPLLSVDLDLPGATRAELEVLAPSARPMTMEFYEHGVRLASYALRGCWGLARRGGALPVRAVVDLPRLPTNASRSQVRDDAEVVRRAYGRVDRAFATAIGALVDPGGKAAPGVVAHVDADALRHALGAIAAEAFLAARAGLKLVSEADALFDAPVLYDAFGRAMSLRALRGGGSTRPLRVHEGREPLPASLEPWFAGAVWVRGLASERALEGLATAPVEELLPQAVAASQRRARALMHPPSKPAVAAAADTIAKETFEVEAGAFAGLRGEIALAAAAHGRPSTARLFVDERPLETVTLTGVRLPLDFALAWFGRIVPRFSYDAVERNQDLARALSFARRLAASFVVGRTKDPATIRAALTMWAEATAELDDGAQPGDLADHAVWRTNDGRLVGLRTIRAEARRTGALCYATSATPARHGRLVLGAADLPALRQLLPREILFVPYDRALGTKDELPEPRPAVALSIERGALSGFVSPGRGRLRVYHGGRRLRDDVWPSRNGPVDIALVDRDAIPQPDLDSFVWSTALVGLGADEDALLAAVVDACEEGAIALESVERYLEESRERLARRGDDEVMSARLADLPKRRQRARAAARRAEVLARPPIDLSAEIRDAVRGSVVRPKVGAVVVTLARGVYSPPHLLFAGHPLGTTRPVPYPVNAWIDVVDESLVDGWTELTPAGASWAQGAVASACLALVRALADRADFADDADALALLVSVYAVNPGGADLAFEAARWPTVQGATMAIAAGAPVRAGTERYATWRSDAERSPHDAPAVHLPNDAIGDLRRRVLAGARVAVTDATEPIARLQARRSSGAPSAAPRLAGAPPSPLLRRSLLDLGATAIEGELELLEGGPDEIVLVDAGGVRRPVSLSVGCPIRAVYRTDVNELTTVARELVVATEQLVRSLGAALPSCPLFVRDRLRALIVAELGRSGRVARADDETLAVFLATDGRWYSLRELRAWEAPVRFTRHGPPYPRGVSALRLGAPEARALAQALPLHDESAELLAIARGDERRAAPPRETIALDPEARAQCIFVFSVAAEGVCGEVGLLHPRHAAARRIELFTTMRPLTRIDAPEGWPVVAALDDAALTPTRAFDGLVDGRGDVARVHRLVRRLVGVNVASFPPAPSGVRGVVRFPSPLVLRAASAVALGVFWLPREWPERPAIDVEAAGFVEKDRLPTIAPGPGAASTVVPVCGRLFVTANAAALPRALEDVMAWVSARLTAHVRAARADAEVEAYRWDLALLGVLDDPALDPVRELATDRPPSALVRVASRRAPHLLDAAAGDAAPAPSPPEPSGREAEPAPQRESFFDGVVRRVVELVRPAPALPATSPLTDAIARALAAMGLTGDPVAGVRERRRGRPVVYDRATRWVVVNAHHPVVKAHAARPTGVLHLTLAALSEINRELVEVTDAEEVAKVLELLRADLATANE